MDDATIAAYSRLCAEVIVGTSVKVGHCPPAFLLFGRDGHLHYGAMQLYNPEPQCLRMWILAANCDIGFVLGSVHIARFKTVEELDHFATMRPGMSPEAYLYMRCELSPRVRRERRVAEYLAAPSGKPDEAIDRLSRAAFADVWCPGYFGPSDLPPIYKSVAPNRSKIKTQKLRPILSVLTDTGAERESVLHETVDEVIRKQIGIQGLT